MNRYLLLTILMMISMVLNSQTPMIIAHRGASYDAPENTLAAVNLAWEKDAEAVEIDVHLSKDRKIMVIHDKDTKRTSGTRMVVKESLSEDLRGLEVGQFKDPDYKGEKIPFLEEVIETVPEGRKLVIEVKCGTEILPILVELIRNSPKREQLVVISFDYEVVKGIKTELPSTPAYWLHYSLAGGYKTKHISMGKDARLDGLNFRFKGISAEFISAVHDAGMEMYAWTVDDPKEARRLMDIGIDGITTNRPTWLKQQLNQYP
jgi:glycerophosphoryl diester phosphodiesterase